VNNGSFFREVLANLHKVRKPITSASAHQRSSPTFSLKIASTDIAIHPSGKFLYVNKQDKIFAFAIDAQAGLAPVPVRLFPETLLAIPVTAFFLMQRDNFFTRP
jgi:6-phosphogluconolactonase (cycloisomerase 2 family)